MLLVRPLPQPGESRQGYLLRLTEANALGTPVRLREVFVGTSARWTTAPGLRGPITGLREMSSPNLGDLPLRYWNTRRPRYCPHCLEERPVWPSLWQLVFYVACHVHGTAMAETCPRCERPVRWIRGALTECGCGASLCEARAQPASAFALHLSRQLASQWGHGSHESTGSAGTGHVEDLLHRTWLLGAYRLGLTRKAQKLANLHCVDFASRVVGAAASVVESWPDGFFALLDDVAAKYGRRDTPRLTDRFGGLYKELFASRRAEAFADLRAGFEQYVLQRWPGQLAARNRRLAPSVLDEHAWVPVARAAKELHWRSQRVRNAIERSLILGRLQARSSGRVSGVVHRQALCELKADVQTWVDLKTVCQLLRVGKKSAKAMLERGELLAVSGPELDGHPVWQFRRKDVESLRLKARVPALNERGVTRCCK